MRLILLVHIIAGGLGLLSGYVALGATKGAPLHRKSGMLFVFVMLPMSVTAMLISAVEGVAPAINIPAALLTFYLVMTALTTVRPFAGTRRWLEPAGMWLAFAIGLTCLTLGLAAGSALAFPLLMFGGIALIAGVGDRRMIRSGGLGGAPRLARHLWRMCFALLVASVAFYPRLGRMGLVPKPLVALPVLAVLVLMFYWLWRVRARRDVRSTGRMRPPEATVVAAPVGARHRVL